ncbi:MAG TPA: Gfo/Idh/MocA family oxidoreductase [Chloroflexota bacterium]
MVRFAVVGINHNHIYGMTDTLLAAGAELAVFHAPEADLAAEFVRRYPNTPRAAQLQSVLDDESIQLVASASISSERGPLGIDVMRHGKDFLSDKPAFTDLGVLEEARRAQRESHRIYGVSYSERVSNRAMVRAAELVQSGAIGKPLQTVGLGPHRLNRGTRPAWFFDKARYGGIITDIGAHQADHFLHFTGSTSASVVCAQVGNLAHPDDPGLEDFGDAVLRGDGGTGYFRVDWFTSDGLAAWGDGRFTVLGTDGFIEVRKNLDTSGLAGSSLFLADQKGQRYVDCSDVDLPYGRQLLADIRDRTETAMPQAQAFLAAELALRAELQAKIITRTPQNVG